MLTRLYTPDMRIIHAVPFGEGFARLIAGTDCGNISVRQSAVPMVKSVIVPSLTRRIRVVLGLGANSQMSRVNTWGVIANVHNDFALRNRPNVKLIRISMSANRLFAGKKKNSVPILVAVSHPLPASIALFKTIFKNILRLYRRIIIQAIRGSSAGVTSTAQFSCNCFFVPTLNAKNLGFGLICHRAPPVAHSI